MGLDNCISSWFCKNHVDESCFSEWINDGNNKTDERTTNFANNLYT